jgi:hypothetical protein
MKAIVGPGVLPPARHLSIIPVSIFMKALP